MVGFDDCRKAGTLGKPHANNGALKVNILPDIDLDLNIKEPVFLIIEGKPVPFFISRIFEAAAHLVLQFELVQDVNEAKKYSGLELYVPQTAIISEDEDSPATLIGYQVHDTHKGELGKITSTFSSGLHDVLVMDYRGTEVLFPYDPNIIEEVDEEEQIVYTILPEGLLGLYLEGEDE